MLPHSSSLCLHTSELPHHLTSLVDLQVLVSISTCRIRNDLIFVGKTLWLHVLLALRVCAALPTVYQKHKDYIYLFNDGRAEKLTLVSDTMDDLLDNIPNNTWWLIDSNLNNFTPPDEVVGELRIVQATSPRSEKTEWVSKTSVDHFFMRTWSVSELFCGYAIVLSHVIRIKCALFF